MGRYYGKDDGTGCGCAVMTAYILLYVISLYLEVYNKLNGVGQLYMITSFAVFLCLCVTVYFWIERNNKKKEAFDAVVRARQKETENYELIKKNRKLEISEKCAWETIEKERKELLMDHNRQDAEFRNRKSQLELEYSRLEENCNSRTDNKLRQLEQEYSSLKNKCEQQVKELSRATSSSKPFSQVAEMYTDLEMCVFKDTERWMRNKKNPAVSSAEKIKELRIKSKEYLSLYKQMEYKYKYLLDVFPELKSYVDDEEELLHLSDFIDYEDFSDNRDRVRDWVPDEEYNRLSEDERNQLALDRFKKRRKSNWEIGMEYEMYVGYILRKDGFYIKQFGIEHGLNDLGRDIIAEKAHLDGSRNIYVIQCKRWSETKFLHENVVCQLFGTTLEYQIKHRDLFNAKIIPLLVTTTGLSNTAKEFAKRLGVLYRVVLMGDYPMIKCNINNGNKIYHLPFDQQYYNTIITEHTGEKYVWTVDEATKLGFRRALRWRGA